jgi:hypothetical protein
MEDILATCKSDRYLNIKFLNSNHVCVCVCVCVCEKVFVKSYFVNVATFYMKFLSYLVHVVFIQKVIFSAPLTLKNSNCGVCAVKSLLAE